MRGISNYKDVYDFVNSIRSKLAKYLKTPFVREFILHDESRINALFLITNNIQSMIAANEIFWKHTQNGRDLSYKHPANTNNVINSFFASLKGKIMSSKKFKQLELINFTTTKRFCIKHTKQLLEYLSLKGNKKAEKLLNC